MELLQVAAATWSDPRNDVAGDEDAKIAASGAQLTEGLQQESVALPREHFGDQGDERGTHRDPELGAHLRTVGTRIPPAGVQGVQGPEDHVW